MKRAYKTELRPNNKQQGHFRRCVGATRYVYNWGLAEWKRQYEGGEKVSAFGLCKQFNGLKDDLCPWIRELPYSIIESSFRNLGNAFQHFFRRVKQGEKEAGYPRFKKWGKHNSFQIRGYKTEVDRVWLGRRMGWVRLKERGYIPSGVAYGVGGGATYATLSVSNNRWFISIQVEQVNLSHVEKNGKVLGVDVGVMRMATCSDGKLFENPKALKQYELKRKRLQRELARRKRGGQNWKKTKDKLASVEARICQTRRHAQHGISHYITFAEKPQRVVVENLNVQGMQKNHRLAEAIGDAGMSELLRQIRYKAEWLGIELTEADCWFASSKLCSNCQHVKKELKLSERIYHCKKCGLKIDRDLNAAKNLAALVEA